MAGIEVQGLCKTYRGSRVPALIDVSLRITTGDICGIIGPNGAGKTTLMGCLLGFLFPDRGTVSIDGLNPDDRSVRFRTGYLPERLVMDRWMRGLDFLQYHHALAGWPSEGRATDVESILRRVGLEKEAALRTVHRYSRGMLQRLGLAQALLGKPSYLFLDEPTSGMDPSGIISFRRLIEEERHLGTTVLINSHQLDELERICTRIVFVQGGRVEVVHANSAEPMTTRELRVRLSADVERATIIQALAISLPHGVRLLSHDGTDLVFAVESDIAATSLLRSLIEAGVPIVNAASTGSRLERLFETGAP